MMMMMMMMMKAEHITREEIDRETEARNY